jgi:aryl carrier-like protein
MTGTQRASVTLAVGVLQRAGLIKNTRGVLEITDQSKLIDAACDCYRMILKLAKKWRTEALPGHNFVVLELLVHFGALAASLS